MPTRQGGSLLAGNTLRYGDQRELLLATQSGVI